MARKKETKIKEWPAWYVPRSDAYGLVHESADRFAGKLIACYFRKDEHTGRTYLVDGSSFEFTDWNLMNQPVPAMVSKEYAMSRITHEEPKR